MLMYELNVLYHMDYSLIVNNVKVVKPTSTNNEKRLLVFYQ